MTLFGKLADGKDGGLMSQNNHLIGVWMPCAFIDQRGTKVKRQDREGDAVGK